MAKEKNKHTSSNKNHNKGLKIVALIVVFILIILIIFLTTKKENIQYTEMQIILNDINISANMEEKVLEKNEHIYISYNDIKKYFDENIYTEEDKIITTSPKKLAIITKGNEEIIINNSKQKNKNTIIEEDNKQYLDIVALQKIYDFEIQHIKETNIITIDSLNKSSKKAYSKKDLNVKENEERTSKNITTIKKGEWVKFINDNNGISKIRTQKGIIGYVKTKYLNNFITEREDFIENDKINNDIEAYKYNLTGKDIKTFEKRNNIINTILQETIKNDKIKVEVISTEKDFYYERFKIEITPVLQECGIAINI